MSDEQKNAFIEELKICLNKGENIDLTKALADYQLWEDSLTTISILSAIETIYDKSVDTTKLLECETANDIMELVDE